ncbi:MAG: hypothetical protein DRP80_01835 [Candidatus Omnitrophota bacterium]|nr:MAG: hypothetical protein DRP80_01835 [Candidatus Omnitrophota bacterium]
MNKGFTLVEIMIVVAIIAILAVIAIPSLLRAHINANEIRTKETLHALVVALESYAAQEGVYPNSEADLTTTTPPYLNEPICGKTQYGYVFSCSGWNSTGYTISAQPSPGGCNTRGSKQWVVTTGNVWTESSCTP